MNGNPPIRIEIHSHPLCIGLANGYVVGRASAGGRSQCAFSLTSTSACSGSGMATANLGPPYSQKSDRNTDGPPPTLAAVFDHWVSSADASGGTPAGTIASR